MRILQILNDDERGGVQTLAAIIEQGLRPHGFVFETVYLFPGPRTTLLRKLVRAAFQLILYFGDKGQFAFKPRRTGDPGAFRQSPDHFRMCMLFY